MVDLAILRATVLLAVAVGFDEGRAAAAGLKGADLGTLEHCLRHAMDQDCGSTATGTFCTHLCMAAMQSSGPLASCCTKDDPMCRSQAETFLRVAHEDFERKCGPFAEAWSSRFREDSPFGEVEVVDVEATSMRFLRCGASLIGAQYIDPHFRDQSPFALFALLQGAVEFMVAPVSPARVLVLGLGAGTVPTALRHSLGRGLDKRARGDGVAVDVVEVSEPVLKAAIRHFGYQAHPRNSRGRTLRRDAIAYILGQQGSRAAPVVARYDIVIHDLYTGDATPNITSEVLVSIRDRWLREDGRGVLLLNMMGAQRRAVGDEEGGPALAAYALTLAMARLLASTFGSVWAFADHPPENSPSHGVSNIVFVATSGGVTNRVAWRVPDTGDLADPPRDSHDWILKNFVRWELTEFRLERSTALRSEELAPQALEDARAYIAAGAWSLVRPMLPPAAWRDSFLEASGDVNRIGASLAAIAASDEL